LGFSRGCRRWRADWRWCECCGQALTPIRRRNVMVSTYDLENLQLVLSIAQAPSFPGGSQL
jgi:hypothetical protein